MRNLDVHFQINWNIIYKRFPIKKQLQQSENIFRLIANQGQYFHNRHQTKTDQP